MTARARIATSLTSVLCVATVALATPARAQTATTTPAAATAPDSTSTPAAEVTPVTAGPTVDAAAVGVRNAAATEAPAQTRRSGGFGQPMALMVVGGAAVLVGLLIGGGAGAAIAVGGAVAGLYGLYLYVQ